MCALFADNHRRSGIITSMSTHEFFMSGFAAGILTAFIIFSLAQRARRRAVKQPTELPPAQPKPIEEIPAPAELPAAHD